MFFGSFFYTGWLFDRKGPPYIDIFKIKFFLIGQIERFGKLNATQKTTALYKAPFLKKSRKTAKNWLFLTKNAKGGIATRVSKGCRLHTGRPQVAG